jgi:hypothetical protein
MDILLNTVATNAAALGGQHHERPLMFLASSLDQQHHAFGGGGHFLGELDELEAQQQIVRNSDSPMGGFDAE